MTDPAFVPGLLLKDLFDPGGLAGKITKIGDLVPPDLAAPDTLDLGDRRRVESEGPFDADAAGHLPDGERRRGAAAAALKDDALKDLLPLLLVLDDADVDLDRITASEFGDVLAHLPGGHFLDECCIHDRLPSLYRP